MCEPRWRHKRSVLIVSDDCTSLSSRFRIKQIIARKCRFEDGPGDRTRRIASRSNWRRRQNNSFNSSPLVLHFIISVLAFDTMRSSFNRFASKLDHPEDFSVFLENVFGPEEPFSHAKTNYRYHKSLHRSRLSSRKVKYRNEYELGMERR